MDADSMTQVSCVYGAKPVIFTNKIRLKRSHEVRSSGLSARKKRGTPEEKDAHEPMLFSFRGSCAI